MSNKQTNFAIVLACMAVVNWKSIPETNNEKKILWKKKSWQLFSDNDNSQQCSPLFFVSFPPFSHTNCILKCIWGKEKSVCVCAIASFLLFFLCSFIHYTQKTENNTCIDTTVAAAVWASFASQFRKVQLSCAIWQMQKNPLNDYYYYILHNLTRASRRSTHTLIRSPESYELKLKLKLMGILPTKNVAVQWCTWATEWVRESVEMPLAAEPNCEPSTPNQKIHKNKLQSSWLLTELASSLKFRIANDDAQAQFNRR